MRSLSRTLMGFTVVALIAAGCATPPALQPKVDPELTSNAMPAVMLGVPIVLGEQRARHLAAAVGPNRTIHVLLAAQVGDRPRHLVVRDGAVHAGDPPPAVMKSGDALDAMFDRQGTLHAIVGQQHFALSPPGWQEIEGPGCQAFVPGGPNLVCLFQLAEPDPRNKTRWDWYGFGAMGIGIIWPWPAHVVKFGIAERTAAGWVERGIVDRASSLSTDYIAASANNDGDIDVVYHRWQNTLLQQEAQTRYERFNAPEHDPAPLPPTRIGARDRDDDSWSLMGITPEEQFFLYQYVTSEWFGFQRVASDPTGAKSLILLVDREGRVWARRAVRGVLGPASMILDEKGYRHLLGLVALGDDRMVALLEENRSGWITSLPQPLRLMEYRNGKWSAPIEVGATAIRNNFGFILSAPIDVGSYFNEAGLLAVDSDSVAVTGVDANDRTYLRVIRFIPP